MQAIQWQEECCAPKHDATKNGEKQAAVRRVLQRETKSGATQGMVFCQKWFAVGNGVLSRILYTAVPLTTRNTLQEAVVCYGEKRAARISAPQTMTFSK